MANKKTVVITGAGGTIASLVLEALREHYDVVALDLRASDGIDACDLVRHWPSRCLHPHASPLHSAQALTLTDPTRCSVQLGPRDAIRAHFKGAYAVVHMAFVPPPSGVSSATVKVFTKSI